MNSRKRFEERKKIVNLIRVDCRTGSRVNLFKFNPAYSEKHENAKFEVFKELIKRGCEVWTEIILTDNSRPDILAFNPKTGRSLIVEILNSETLKTAKVKAEKYPIEVIFIDSKLPLKLEEIDL